MKHTEYIIPIGEEAKEFDEIFIGVLRKHKELIRCKDCKYNHGGICWWHNSSDYSWVVDDDDYCSCAERRNNVTVD